MNWDQIAGSWQQLQGNVKARWGKLTDNDMTYIAGKRDVLAGKLREYYGYSQEQLEKEIDDFLKSTRH